MKEDEVKKLKFLVFAVVLSMFALVDASAASAKVMTSEENSIAMNVAYAEQILYCDSGLRFKTYENGQFFDNNGGCVDPTAVFIDGNGWSDLQAIYQGGMYRWHIQADDGKSCDFYIYHGDPDADSQILAWDTFFTACSVRINQPVSDKWVMYDYEFPETSPVIGACDATVPDFAGYENNCLEFAYEELPSGDVVAGTGTYINKAADILKKKFYAPFKAWIRYDRNLNHMYAIVTKYPAGVKVSIQKRVDGKWFTMKTGELLWEGRSSVFYNKASAGKYRVFIKSVTGLKYISKTFVV